MYIRRIKGPHSVTLPGGTVMTRADLPDPETRRWVASRKAAVVRAVDHGLITEAEARETWDLSEERTGILARCGRTPWRGRAQGHGAATLPRSQGCHGYLKSLPFSENWIPKSSGLLSCE
jgi:hypothetical protein